MTNKQRTFYNELIAQGRQGGTYTRICSDLSCSDKDAWYAIQELLSSEGDASIKSDENFNNEMVKEYEQAKANNFERQKPANLINPNHLQTKAGIDDLKDTITSTGIQVNDIEYYHSKSTNSQYLTIDTDDGKIKVAMGNHYINGRTGKVEPLEPGQIEYDQKTSGQDTQYDSVYKIGLERNGRVDIQALTELIGNEYKDINKEFKANENIDYSKITKSEKRLKQGQKNDPLYSVKQNVEKLKKTNPNWKSELENFIQAHKDKDYKKIGSFSMFGSTFQLAHSLAKIQGNENYDYTKLEIGE